MNTRRNIERNDRRSSHDSSRDHWGGTPRHPECVRRVPFWRSAPRTQERREVFLAFLPTRVLARLLAYLVGLPTEARLPAPVVEPSTV
jgi:hypothetical protein